MTYKLRVLSHYLCFLLFITHLSNGLSSGHRALLNKSEKTKPVAELGQRSVVLNEIRRRLGILKICALCTRCGAPKGLCFPSPYCYDIICNTPHRPFGFCCFTPMACNCFECHH